MTNTPAVVTPDEMMEVQNFADAFAILKAAGLEPTVVNEFELIEDKKTLIDVPFIILSYKFHPGDYGGEFVSVSAITDQNKKIVFNDGSTGIRAQLQALSDKGIQTGIICMHGLRVSEYYYNADTKEVSNDKAEGFAPASTFYLD